MALKERYILMLEDDLDDRYLTNAVLQELNLEATLRFLSNTNSLFSTIEASQPFLIITDFNLNPETGFDILKKIKGHRSFQHIPVVILGDSNNADFIAECYRLGASTYAIKPRTLEETKNKITLFIRYWLEVAETMAPNSEPSKSY